MNTPLPYMLVSDAVPALLDFLQAQAFHRLFLVTDQNAYRVLGQRVEATLRAQAFEVKTILLTGELHTSEHTIAQALMETNGEDRVFIAVGSGTITDITRFISHRSREPFISLPTAPSVDGYTSTVAPTVVGLYKYPIPAQAPIAVIADLPTLCSAPRSMIAAGFGDLLGKYTSLADWRIGSLLYDERYDPQIADQMRAAVDRVVEVIDSLAASDCEGVTRLMDGLIGSGFGMLAFGESRPASGSEHHLGHYWEMINIIQGRKANLHGAEVAVGTLLSAKRYARFRALNRVDAAQLLARRAMPTRQEMIEEIEQAYGPVSELITQIQAPLLSMTAPDLERLKVKIIDQWDELQAAAQFVPAPETMITWLQAVGAPSHPEEIGLSDEETHLGLKSAHYLRDRFTMNRLAYWLGWKDTAVIREI